MRHATTQSQQRQHDQPQPPPRILIVNHHADTNRPMEFLLFLSGFDAESVLTIADAEARLERRRYDLILCRNTASDGYGPRLIERAWKKYRIASIGMTGVLSKEKMTAEVNPPEAIKDVLIMPISQELLVDAIKRALPPECLRAASLMSQNEFAQPRRCDDCRGSGHVDLLIRRVTCTRCNGRGEVAPDPDDLPLRHVTTIPAMTRMALHRAGFHTMRQIRNATTNDIQSRAKLSDTAMSSVVQALQLGHEAHAMATA